MREERQPLFRARQQGRVRQWRGEVKGAAFQADGSALRGTFVVDPEGTVRAIHVNDPDVGRNVQETLRLLRALRTGELCPEGWTPGQATLSTRPDPARPGWLPGVPG